MKVGRERRRYGVLSLEISSVVTQGDRSVKTYSKNLCLGVVFHHPLSAYCYLINKGVEEKKSNELQPP